jgi:hypothetical protein
MLFNICEHVSMSVLLLLLYYCNMLMNKYVYYTNVIAAVIFIQSRPRVRGARGPAAAEA